MIRFFIIKLIRFYQIFISPAFRNHCKFQPSCSQYSLAAYQRFSFWKATWLTIKRIGRCQPFSKGGFDPLPENPRLKTYSKD